MSDPKQKELYSSSTLELEASIWQRVNTFKESGIVKIKGMPDSDEDWLRELEKHQALIAQANTIWPDLPPQIDTMSEIELAVLAGMLAVAQPSEDALWVAN